MCDVESGKIFECLRDGGSIFIIKPCSNNKRKKILFNRKCIMCGVLCMNKHVTYPGGKQFSRNT